MTYAAKMHIDELSGRELDAAVGERIMGFELDPNQRSEDGAPRVISDLPEYSSRMPTARGISLLLEQRHPGVLTYAEASDPCCAVAKAPSGTEYRATASSEATALCRAMLKLLDGEGPGQDPKKAKSLRGPKTFARLGGLLGDKAEPHQHLWMAAKFMALSDEDASRRREALSAMRQWVSSVFLIPSGLVYEREEEDDGAIELIVVILQMLVKAGGMADEQLRNFEAKVSGKLAQVARQAREHGDSKGPGDASL